MYLSWLGLLKVTNVMQDSLVHSSGMRVKSVSSSAVLSFCRDALGSFDKWLRAAAISITTFFCPPPSGFQVVGFSFWDFPNKWGGWRPRKTNNKASEILTSDSSMRKLRSQAIACKMTVVNRPPIMLNYNCVTQLMLYTGDKLSSPIFPLWVSVSGIGVTRPNLHFFQYIQAYKPFANPVPPNTSTSTNSYWPSTSQYRHILTQYHQVPLIIHHLVRLTSDNWINFSFLGLIYESRTVYLV